MIVLKVGEGALAKEEEYKVTKTTKYFGADRKELAQGLRHDGFRPNAEVRFRLSGNREISEMWLAANKGP
jgi:hypothetical protein